MKRIVVGMDGSSASGAALRWAVEEADLRHLEVEATHAWSFLGRGAAGEAFDPHYGEPEAKAALETWVADAVGETARTVGVRVTCDLPARALIEDSEVAAVLVVGARGVGGFRGLLLGSVSSKVIRETHCPTAVIREGPSETGEGGPTRVVVGIDGSACAQNALTWAADEARRRGARLDVVHTWHPPYIGGFPFADMPYDQGSLREGARQVLEHAVHAMDLSDVGAHQVLIEGSAAGGLVAKARGVDLLVVGARGIGALERAVFGSTSSQVVHHAECPVVVIPAG